ncbi:hypothetical protein LCGC14_2391730, partial [marine sediment metagenome]
KKQEVLKNKKGEKDNKWKVLMLLVVI